jgi:hypothetical protein
MISIAISRFCPSLSHQQKANHIRPRAKARRANKQTNKQTNKMRHSLRSIKHVPKQIKQCSAISIVKQRFPRIWNFQNSYSTMTHYKITTPTTVRIDWDEEEEAAEEKPESSVDSAGLVPTKSKVKHNNANLNPSRQILSETYQHINIITIIIILFARKFNKKHTHLFLGIGNIITIDCPQCG